MKKILIASLCLVGNLSFADTNVTLISTASPNINYGTVNFKDSQYGLLITPQLTNIPAGLHGFHIHVNASCAEQGNAAGGHLDPENTGKHLGPYNIAGHLGDLPVLYVKADGTIPTILLWQLICTDDAHRFHPKPFYDDYDLLNSLWAKLSVPFNEKSKNRGKVRG